MNRIWIAALASAAAITTPAFAQDMAHDHAHMDPAPAAAPPMDHSGMDHGAMADMAMPSRQGPENPVPAAGSGTSRLPANEGPMRGLHVMAGNWMLMAHGYVSGQYTDHSGPRGDDNAYITSMAMLTAERETGFGRVQLRSMLSLEPAMQARGYPNLFATGETAGGVALVDRQHPHDLFMELAARVDFDIAPDTRLFLYGGPVGEPALGPSAFVMRASSGYNPEPPIAHHWFDSTHITYGVVTAGLASSRWQIEGSAFRGAEPDEHRWNIETPKLDSWSVRATFHPGPQWALQASYGQIHEPETLHPGEDEHRFTASAHYADGKGFTAMAGFSAKDRVPGRTLTAWLGEANWNLDAHNTLFGRIENVANDELFPDHHDPLHDRAFRVTKLQAGYARRIALDPFELALGGSLATFAKPDALDAAYGSNPWGYTLFARLSLGS
ncbi:hypothetical protein [Novosphingobium album (ex Liu et al. 2023)]|uniref:Alginate export domain-containing protein n=1 Tax=Novosphingobium album (ex Liu et al. 2023) TaxID=3031130 RepID=A0ABT5WTW8_9SPHN|nr:hypothetical protein [Novosphingobium album (ex Liu et al. 2023)]MDE8653340.1 hypothetical protein [Novosphingobium album (ex Liu et al. 2023)]